MSEFDAAQPALLHDARTGRMVTWDWARAEDFRRRAIFQADGRVISDDQGVRRLGRRTGRLIRLAAFAISYARTVLARHP